MLSEASLSELVRMYRLQVADVAALFVPIPIDDQQEKKGGSAGSSTASKKIKLEEGDKEYIGLCDDGRLVMKTSVMENEDESMKIGKNLLGKCTGLTIHSDLIDLGIYVMSYWTLEVIVALPRLSCLRLEIIPFFLNHQFLEAKYLMGKMPSLAQVRSKRPCSDMESWLLGNTNHTSLTRIAAAAVDSCPHNGAVAQFLQPLPSR